MLQDMELIEGQTIAIDSFKVRAQNNFRKNYCQKKIDRHIDYIDTKIEQYEQELEEADAAEKEQLRVKITTQRQRRQKYEALERKLAESGDTQISVTDPEAKALRVSNNGTQQIIEHQFGMLKRQWGFTFTLLKRKKNVMPEVHLLMMAYNLTRMIAIIGINEFKRRLGGLSAYLLALIATPRTNFAALCRFKIFKPKSLKPNFAII